MSHRERMENIARTLLRELGEDEPYAEIMISMAGHPHKRLCYQPNLKRVLEAIHAEVGIQPYAKRCDRFSAALERIMEICREERLPSQIFEIAEEALIEEESK